DILPLELHHRVVGAVADGTVFGLPPKKLTVKRLRCILICGGEIGPAEGPRCVLSSFAHAATLARVRRRFGHIQVGVWRPSGLARGGRTAAGSARCLYPSAPMRLLITGAAGMLGLDVRALATARGHELVALTRNQLDVTDNAAVVAAFEQARPDAVINCA